MCRLAGYLGDARSIASLILERAHSLEVQSYAPREMDGALLNADGFGMAWYTDGVPQPALYRTVLPIWADENVRRIAPHLITRCALANARSATIGMPSQLSNVSPFVEGAWAFTHNGVIRDFGSVRRAFSEGIDDAHYPRISGNTDSEHLFACVMSELARSPNDPAGALRRTIERVRTLGVGALLNLMLTDGHELYAVRAAINANAPSLYLRRSSHGTEIVSEPLDDHGFEPVSPDSLLRVVRSGEVTREAL